LYEHQGKFYDPLLGQFIQPPEPTTLPTAAAHSITPDALAMTDQARETPSQFEYLLGETWANKVAGKIVDEVVERIFPEEIFVQFLTSLTIEVLGCAARPRMGSGFLATTRCAVIL
jgi:hypothetical protein